MKPTSQPVSPSVRGKSLLLALLTFLSLVVAVATASGEDPGDRPSPAIGSEPQAEGMVLPEPTNPEGDFDVPFAQMGRAQSGDLLKFAFEPVLEAAGGPFDDFQVRKFLAPDVAVVSVEDPEGGSHRVLVDSTTPLQAETDSGSLKAIDLELAAAGGTIEAENPLVAVEIPAQAGDPIKLPDAGIGIRLATGADARQASVLDDQTAFYPEVAADTDFAVSPTPLGFETLTQVRSAKAPDTQRLRLALPDGATMSPTGKGGAKVLQDGQLLMTVDPPSAIDAAGEEVPVTMDVAGSGLVLRVSPAADATYPILVDPLFQTYEWAKYVYDWQTEPGPQPPGIHNDAEEWNRWLAIWNTQQAEEWSPERVATGWFYLALDKGANYNNPIGLYVSTTGGSGSVTNGEHAAWKYAVPRFYADQAKYGTIPQTYISKMKLWNLTQMTYGKRPSPYMQLGLMRPNNTWASILTHTGLSEHHLTDLNYVYEFNGDQESKFGAVGLWAQENYAASEVGTNVFVQSAQIELSEPAGNLPKFGTPLAGPSAWVHNTAKPLEFVASDNGLGVYAMNISPDYPGTPPSSKTLYGCVGAGDDVCPHTWSSADAAAPVPTYDPSVIPSGVKLLNLVAEDPLGNKSAAGKVELKVDHIPPLVALSGQATEQATLGTKQVKYALKVNAKDGDEAIPSANTPLGSAGTGSGQYERPMGVAVAPDGSVYSVDRLNNRVIKYDANGNFVLQFGGTGSAEGQFNDPRGITVAPDGTVWVADLGNDRIQAFSPSGTFLRKGTFTDPLSQPYALASGPGGVLWVTDIGLHRVVKVAENPVSTLGFAAGNEQKPTGSPTDLNSPTGVATDSFGNVWVVDGIGKVFMFNAAGQWKFQFGTAGTANGQLKSPVSIDIGPSGNLAVMDRENNRVQIFKPNGTYVRQFGTLGSGNSQLFEAVGIAIGPENQLYIADAGNKRIARWNNADVNVQSGVVKTEIKVDNVLKDTYSPGCSAGKNCSASREWTLNADDYAVGNHTVKVIATDAAGVQGEKTLTVETHGDRTAPTNVLTGTITQQATLGQTRPAYTAKLEATDPGPADQRKSGVASIEFKVDGVKVDSIAPGCPNEGCSLTREWTLNSNNYAPGWHFLEAISTDAAGKQKVSFREFTIKRDEVAPEFQNLAPFYTAPSGWLEQQSYEPKVDVVDGNGYGVTSVQLKIDGQVVQSTGASCPAGGCSRQLGYGQSVNLANYEGGAHPAELVATDGAGNTRKRTWTINVNPAGQIPTEEAVSTLEAFDDTSESVLIAPNSEIISAGEQAAGNDPVLHDGILELNSTGTPNVSTISVNTEDGFAIGVPDSTVEVEPLATAAGASGAEVVEESAAVATNTGSGVDTILRPVFDGIMSFQSIRDATATEYFSWEVLLREGQTLHQINEDSAEIWLSDGTPAMSILAEPAHDAVGKEVPTSLTVSAGNIVTLRVQHKSSSFTYPVTGGTGWKGGYSTETVAAPKDQKELIEERWKREEEERIRNEEAKAEEERRLEEIRLGINVPEYSHGYSGPEKILPYDNRDDGGATASSSHPHYGHFYWYDQCTYDGPGGCTPYKLTTKTWIEYNHRFVWWKNDGIHPSCFKSTHGFTADLTFCNWVGQNHQPNYGGYHITSRGVWDLAPLGGPWEREEPVSVYAYPSGYANGHNTFCVCNPST